MWKKHSETGDDRETQPAFIPEAFAREVVLAGCDSNRGKLGNNILGVRTMFPEVAISVACNFIPYGSRLRQRLASELESPSER